MYVAELAKRNSQNTFSSKLVDSPRPRMASIIINQRVPVRLSGFESDVRPLLAQIRHNCSTARSNPMPDQTDVLQTQTLPPNPPSRLTHPVDIDLKTGITVDEQLGWHVNIGR